MNEKKKVLIVNEPLSYGGMNIASIRFEENLNKDKFECVYCVRRNCKGALEQTVLDRGVRVIHVPDNELNYYKSYKFYKKLMRDEHFDIVHCHLPFFSGIVLLAAAECGVSKRVAHAHFSHPYTDTAIYSRAKQAIAVIYRKVMRLLLKKYCNVKLACSREAGEFLYGKREFAKNGIILNNGIDTLRFKFNFDMRSCTRKELNISSASIVLGHIGQLYSVKNQSFLIDIFNKFHNENPNSYLLLIGEGSDKEMLTEKIKVLGLESNVLLLGGRNDIPELLCAMDCFVFPSIHEGFPLTLIEAQASKLPCVISDAVTDKTKINDNIFYLSIDESPETWTKYINKAISFDRESVDNTRVISDFDINNISKKLEQIYFS
ncbi:MAG: glycosyltransferase [Eubacterium sp.]